MTARTCLLLLLLVQPVSASVTVIERDGQILEEGINEAGAFSAWLAAATSYSTSAYTMEPFYIF